MSFFFYSYGDHRHLHSFPTRRSSDLSISLGCNSDASCASASPRISRQLDRKSTRLNSSHLGISYAVFCLKKKKTTYFTLAFCANLFLCRHHRIRLLSCCHILASH